MGCYAVDLIKQGIGNRVVAVQGNDIVDYDILEGLSMSKKLDERLLEIADILRV